MSDAEPIDKLAAALVKALGELKDVAKTRTANVGQYKYTYADLGDAMDMVRPILTVNGLGVMQSVSSTERGVGVSTVIIHESGQTMTFGPLVMPAGNTPQATGSAITYARRYSLLAALGLATEEDDDGQAAARPPQQRSKPQATRGAPPPDPSSTAPVAGDDDEVAEMRRLLEDGIQTNAVKALYMAWCRGVKPPSTKVPELSAEHVRAAYVEVFAA